MAQRIERFNLPVAAGLTAGDSIVFSGGDGTVTAITVHFPSGCANKVGVQVFYASAQVIPRTALTFLYGNGEALRFPVSGFPTGTSWGWVGANGDIYPHTISFDFELDELAATSADPGLPPLVLMPFDETQIGTVFIPGAGSEPLSAEGAITFASLGGADGGTA